jgi:CubicO group peptidase (beta-lactamase class C family)
MLRAPRVAAVALVALIGLPGGASSQNLVFSLFERYLESLRIQAGIPGLSAAVVQDGTIVWERGFGLADVENGLPARPDTPYHIADLTQVFTTLVLAQCSERARVQPDDSIRRWVPLADPPASVRQLLSHTSGAAAVFKYDPGRFALLTAVAEQCDTKPFSKVMADELLSRLAMTDAAPGRDFAVIRSDDEPLFDAAAVQRYGGIVQRMAVPYKVDRRGRATRGDLPPPTLNAASGLVASVRDIAKFDKALTVLVRPDSLERIWTNERIGDTAVPMGLGWFVQTYQNDRLVWHFGVTPDGYSALLLKVPARQLTLVLLANSDGLSVPFPLQDGDVTSSLFAHTFLRLFL